MLHIGLESLERVNCHNAKVKLVLITPIVYNRAVLSVVQESCEAS